MNAKQLNSTSKFGLFLIPVTLILGLLGNPVEALSKGFPNTPISSNLDSALQLVEADSQKIVLEFTTPQFEIVDEQLGSSIICQQIVAPDYAQTDQPGKPQLPVKGTVIALPVDASAQLVVLEAEAKKIEGVFRICPVETYEVQDQPLLGQELLPQYSFNDEAYGRNQNYPALVAEVISTGYLRSQHIAQVRVHPYQYNPVSGELFYYPRLQIQINIESPQMATADPQMGIYDEGSFEALLQKSVLNYQQAREWRKLPSSERELAFAPQSTTGPQFKLFIEQTGIYQVSYEYLAAAGADLANINPDTFQIFNQGAEIALLMEGTEDSSFDPGDQIVFFGEAVDQKYTATNVYFLTWGKQPGQRMELVTDSTTTTDTLESFTSTRHFEQNKYYLSTLATGDKNDHWYWDYLSASTGPVTKTYTVNLQNISPSAGLTATLRASLRGTLANPQHHTRLLINNNLVSDNYWAPTAELNVEVAFPHEYLLEGDNKITVVSPRDGGITQDLIQINWFEIDFHSLYMAEDDQLFFTGDPGKWQYHLEGFTDAAVEVYDISQIEKPAKISDLSKVTHFSNNTNEFTFELETQAPHQYLAITNAKRLLPAVIEKDEISDLHSTSNAADYILITHSDFYTDVLPLANWRSQQHLRVEVVKVEDIYDEFSAGLMSPVAIRDFLAYAYHNWQSPKPQFVLLVGDGNYDPRNYMKTGEPNFIPPYLETVDLWLGENAADNRFVTVSGNDNFPDLFIGRLPVKTAQAASALVNKIVAYEQSPSQGDWNQSVVFVTDNNDSAGNFTTLSDGIVNDHLPTSYVAKKIYYGVTHPTITETRLAISDAFNQGALLINYIGHGSVQGWATENLLSNSRVAAFLPNSKQPLVVSMSCLVGAFYYPSAVNQNNSSLAEMMLSTQDKGAIAVWASAGMGLASGQDLLNRGFFTATLTNHVSRLGEAVMLAKLHLFSTTSSYRDLLDNYTLFGDPATMLQLVKYSNYLPVVVSR